MNSKWQANRIGFLNFWYYDEQEYYFAKGRMLLRGSNGSGKSVTMQSVIPLLLDGNMSPERLDPFGSRDRRMNSYLLEEDDEREERTGYLYLEFRREESDTFITIGMGIRARKGKPLDKWYFSLTDGRRIRKDFYLYKETNEKLPLSRKELENRIGEGGLVFDRQAEYMAYVNKTIFGFETVEEYKELLDLLLQLRTPKLSKDLKPSVINEILSNSLQPLSDDDLRPMSEAIENMDTMSMNLKAKVEGKQAADRICRVLDRYNRLELYTKADALVNSLTELETLKKDELSRGQKLKNCEARTEELGKLIDELDVSRSAMEKERETLSKSDALMLKRRETELSSSLAEKEKNIKEKESQLSAKQEQCKDVKGRREIEAKRASDKEEELDKLLKSMRDEAGDMSFEEHGFFEADLKENLQQPFSFDTHRKLFTDTREKIEQGLELLKECKMTQARADEMLRLRDQKQREADGAQRRAGEAEDVLIQAENEWKEALYSWNGSNQELKLSDELMKALAVFADGYDENADYPGVRQKIADVWIERKGLLDTDIRNIESESKKLKDELTKYQSELEEWLSHREPEPERDEAVIRNRETLKEAGIPYEEFYKTVEFGPDMDETACGRLEEALLRMGILDALIIDDSYRDQVLRTDSECCDNYLFVENRRAAEQSLLDALDLNGSTNDIFYNYRITGILGSIAYTPDDLAEGLRDAANGGVKSGRAEADGAAAHIGSNGTWRMGPLTGTVTGSRAAGFIGTRARENKRQQNIANCREKIEKLETELSTLTAEITRLKKRVECLRNEYLAFPADNDLKAAFRMLTEAREELERLLKDGLRLDEQFRELNKQLNEGMSKALGIAKKLYLSCDYDTFCRADAAARQYDRHLNQLAAGQEIYLQIEQRRADLDERIKELSEDMAWIREDLRGASKQADRDRAELRSVREQLSLTDYDEIRDRLEALINWLNAYPDKLREYTEERGQLINEVRTIREELDKGAGAIEKAGLRSNYLRKCFEAELGLGYVAFQKEDAGNGQTAEQSAIADPSIVRNLLETDCRDLLKENVIRDLNRVYFENRGFLNDYQITQSELFEELERDAYGPPAAKRLDIMARYQGVRIPFIKLPDHLLEEIEQLQELIRDGDRELFEDILANTMSRKIRGRINGSMAWVEKMNALMGAMNTSSGLRLNLRWRSRTAEREDQLDTKELVDLLKKDYRLMREDEAARLSQHFRSRVEEARRHAGDSGGMISFYQVMKETLDYRKWFEFQLFYQKTGERQKELTNNAFGTFSGGEKAMSMYVPLFSAVVAKYQGGREDAPRLISLDEAFAGVDNRNIRDMFRLMREFRFDFIINSQQLWGDCDTLDTLAIYQLIRPGNAKFITVMAYLWNGKEREMLEDGGLIEQRAEGTA